MLPCYKGRSFNLDLILLKHPSRGQIIDKGVQILGSATACLTCLCQLYLSFNRYIVIILSPLEDNVKFFFRCREIIDKGVQLLGSAITGFPFLHQLRLFFSNGNILMVIIDSDTLSNSNCSTTFSCSQIWDKDLESLGSSIQTNFNQLCQLILNIKINKIISLILPNKT